MLVAEEKSETIEVREEDVGGKGEEEGAEEMMEGEDVLSRLRSEKEGEVTGGEDGEEEQADQRVFKGERGEETSPTGERGHNKEDKGHANKTEKRDQPDGALPVP